jgi:RNA polymerase sigma-70 factor, ECF subfamily
MAATTAFPDESPAEFPAVTGDAALSALWAAHGSVLRRFALKLTRGDWQRADEVVQETLLRAWRHPEVVGSGTAIRSWLFTVTRRAAIDLWRSRRTAEAAEEPMGDRHLLLPDPVEPIERTVAVLDVRAALARLSPKQRAVLTEMYLNGHTVVETAAILGVPVGTVKSRSYAALRALRESLLSAAPTAERPAPERWPRTRV